MSTTTFYLKQFLIFDIYWVAITNYVNSCLLKLSVRFLLRKAPRHVFNNVLRLCWFVNYFYVNFILQNTSRCKFLWKPLQGRPSPLRSSLLTLSKMSKLKSKIKKVSLPINNVWSSPASNLKMDVHCPIITSKKVCWFIVVHLITWY